MDDDAVQLVVVLLAKLLGIGAHGVERYHDVAANDARLVVVEGYDVGVIVVAQVLVVYLKYLLVVHKHVAYLAHL